MQHENGRDGWKLTEAFFRSGSVQGEPKKNELGSDYIILRSWMFLLMSYFSTAGIWETIQESKWSLCTKMKMIFAVSFPGMLNWITLSLTPASTSVGTFSLCNLRCVVQFFLISWYWYWMGSRWGNISSRCWWVPCASGSDAGGQGVWWPWNENRRAKPPLRYGDAEEDRFHKHNIHTGERNKRTELQSVPTLFIVLLSN